MLKLDLQACYKPWEKCWFDYHLRKQKISSKKKDSCKLIVAGAGVTSVPPAMAAQTWL